MATLTKVTPSLASITPADSQKFTAIAGEAIANHDMLYMKSDGKLWKADGTAVNAKALSLGIALRACAAGEPITCGWGIQVEYGASLVPGARYYLSATAGLLDDAATTGGTVAVAFAVDANRIFVLPPTR